MVKSVTNFASNGLREWLIQRLSALVIGSYLITMIVFFLTHSNLDFITWHAFMGCRFMQIFTVVTMFSILAHAWIGLWIVTTDYVKCICIRLPLQALIILALIGMFIWTLAILWG